MIKQLLGGLFLVGCMGHAVAAAGEEPASAGATTATTIRPAVATELADSALSQLRPEAAVWLELEDGVRTLGLFYPEQEPPAKGALVILADVGDNAAAGVADELSRHLTAKGWSVLAVGLPAPSPPLQRYLEAQPEPAPATEADAGTDGSNGDSRDESSVMIDVMAAPTGDNQEQVYRNRVRQSLAAAAAALTTRGYNQPVLVGLGRASSHLMATDGELQGAPALIWVVPEFYPRDAAALADKLAGSSEVAILELYASRGDASTASQRRWADLRRAGIERLDRQPVAVSRPLSVHGAGTLAGRIDAWLKAR